ncbi:MAG: protein-methionine-sulfoxide reductase heme-binding subunit MsrQ [Myxococcota bacterium]
MIHAIAIALAALPALILAAQFLHDGPGANPIEDITHLTGKSGLRLILLSLAITPLRRFFGWKGIAPLRRTLGLAGFSYACLHLLTWSFLDLGLDLGAILEDLTERPYVMAGMASFTLLLCLAVTSTRSSMRRLGKRWVQLHQVVYVAAILAVVHHFWLTKADYRPAIIHAVVLATLLGARLVWSARRPTQAT